MNLSNSLDSSYNGISLIIPVMNEEENITKLISGLIELSINDQHLMIKEIIFVDDGSTDKTKEIINGLSHSSNEVKIILKERFAKKGTVNAQLFGISQASYNTVLIMDGDLQHPVDVIPYLIKKYKEGYDMVIASRYVRGGTAHRTAIHGVISRGANFLARIMLPWTSPIRDPISGFFIVNRRIVPYPIEISGFNKLALYIFTCRKNISVTEIPFHFKERESGHSKVSNGGIDFVVRYLGELRYYRFLRRVVLGKCMPRLGSSEYRLFRLCQQPVDKYRRYQ